MIRTLAPLSVLPHPQVMWMQNPETAPQKERLQVMHNLNTSCRMSRTVFHAEHSLVLATDNHFYCSHRQRSSFSFSFSLFLWPNLLDSPIRRPFEALSIFPLCCAVEYGI